MTLRSARLLVPVALAALAMFGATSAARAEDAPTPLSVSRDFAKSIDLTAFRLTAAQDDGRVKTFDSFAIEKLKLINQGKFGDTDPVVMFLDMILVPEHYQEADSIYIRKQPVRKDIVTKVRNLVPAAQRQSPIADADLERIEKTGFCSPAFLDHPAVRHVVGEMERDLMRSSKDVDALKTARALADSHTLLSIWRPIAPPGGHPLDLWHSLGEMDGGDGSAAPADATHAGMRSAGGSIPGLRPEQSGALTRAWADLAAGWRFQDVGKVSAALNSLAATFAVVEPALYPSHSQRALENWYNRLNKMTWDWLIYLAALPFLLMAVVYRIGWARRVGIGLFLVAFLIHTAAIAWRWYIAGRIPNANMFEAVTASAWFGGLAAIILELVLRRWQVKNLPALAASTYAMTAMMVGHFMPVQLNSDIGTLMPVLDRTVWLYIHTNMVIASYALIFFGSVTAALYLILRGATAFVAPTSAFAGIWRGDGEVEARAGGAATIILGKGGNDMRPAGLAKTLDGATMIFLEVAFLMLFVGTILGAVWADVSWGRPWGWDPKEVFAMNTWLVFLALVHVRLKVQDKALWTAVLAVIGCGVMLFNWIAVNFQIVGLHSYA